MGYMGFGMRKEVYTRKPKRAFEKIKELYDAEKKNSNAKDQSSQHTEIDDELKQRIRNRLKRQRRKELVIKISVTIIVVAALLVFVINRINNYTATQNINHPIKVSDAFKRKIFKNSSGVYMIADYYVNAGIASAFRYKDGMKHQGAESYYSSGERFRSAFYYNDTLVNEYYFYKNGDTIKNFPKVNPEVLTHITLYDNKREKEIYFDMLDYKILIYSYAER